MSWADWRTFAVVVTKLGLQAIGEDVGFALTIDSTHDAGANDICECLDCACCHLCVEGKRKEAYVTRGRVGNSPYRESSNVAHGFVLRQFRDADPTTPASWGHPQHPGFHRDSSCSWSVGRLGHERARGGGPGAGVEGRQRNDVVPCRRKRHGSTPGHVNAPHPIQTPTHALQQFTGHITSALLSPASREFSLLYFWQYRWCW